MTYGPSFWAAAERAAARVAAWPAHKRRYFAAEEARRYDVPEPADDYSWWPPR